MSIRGLKVPVILLTFAALLFAGLFAQKALRDTRVVEPLQEELQTLDGVKDVRADQRDGLTDLTVTLGLVDNIGEKYGEIVKIASTQLKGDLGEIELVDDRTPELEEAYYRLHFVLQEAVATGAFGGLERAGEAVAEDAALAGQRIYVRESYVAVQLVSSDGHYLYEIVARPPATPRGIVFGSV